jgi:hypothetical protein
MNEDRQVSRFIPKWFLKSYHKADGISCLYKEPADLRLEFFLNQVQHLCHYEQIKEYEQHKTAETAIDNGTYLIIGSNSAPPSREEFLYRQTEIEAAILERNLFRLLQQLPTQFVFDHNNTLKMREP